MIEFNNITFIYDNKPLMQHFSCCISSGEKVVLYGPSEPVEKPEADQVSMLDMSGQAVCRELQKVAVETLTPIEAMNLLFRLKQML